MSLSFYVQKIESAGVGFSYIGFDKFRHRIARSIGLKDVYSSMGSKDMYASGRYKEIESGHPMWPLIGHSDTDGDIGPEDCGKIGACLKTLIQEWEKELKSSPDEELEIDIEKGKRLADVMMRCYENNEILLFM